MAETENIINGGGSNDVRDYQTPTPAWTRLAKPSKVKAVAKKGGSRRRVCFRCGKASAKCRACGQCHRAWYCGRDCQRADWTTFATANHWTSSRRDRRDSAVATDHCERRVAEWCASEQRLGFLQVAGEVGEPQTTDPDERRHHPHHPWFRSDPSMSAETTATLPFGTATTL